MIGNCKNVFFNKKHFWCNYFKICFTWYISHQSTFRPKKLFDDISYTIFENVLLSLLIFLKVTYKVETAVATFLFSFIFFSWSTYLDILSSKKFDAIWGQSYLLQTLWCIRYLWYNLYPFTSLEYSQTSWLELSTDVITQSIEYSYYFIHYH